MSTYISASDTAKLIRAQLKKNFPECKFWVTSETYSGGASINIHWIDGPAEEKVKAITNAFNGAGFDGMNDYKTSNAAYLLPDGSATFAEIERYDDNNLKFDAPANAERVRFGADYIFTHRHFSPEFAKPIIQAVCADFGKPEPKYYENDTYFSRTTKSPIKLLDWDCLSPNWGNEDRSIGFEIRNRLNATES